LSSVLDESSALLIGLSSLSYLGLSSNHIQSVSRHAFRGLDSLRHVDVTDNNVSSVQENAFARLRNLNTVYVSLAVCVSVFVPVVLWAVWFNEHTHSHTHTPV